MADNEPWRNNKRQWVMDKRTSGQVDMRTSGHADSGQITDTWDVVVLLRQQLELDYKHLHVLYGVGFPPSGGWTDGWGGGACHTALSLPRASTFSGRT